MRFIVPVSFIFSAALASAAGAGDDSVATLIKKLGSANFREREGAAKALKGRPDAMAALEEAARAGDHLEMRRRASDIFEYLRLRDLNSAVDNGDFERFIKLASTWPAAKLKEELWPAAERQAALLANLHRKRGGEKIRLIDFRVDPRARDHVFDAPFILDAKKVTIATKADGAGLRYYLSVLTK